MALQNIWSVYDCGGGENDIMILWLFIIGFLSGIISGMGIGGGTILIPALSIFFDYEQHTAQNFNLIYFIPTAIIALFTHAKSGNIQKKGLLKIILFGIVGASLGAVLAINMEADILRKCFGVFLFIMGIYEIFKKNKKTEKVKEEQVGYGGQ